MVNEIRANIDVRGEQVAAAKLKKVGDAAEKAGDSLEELGGQATDAGKATEKSGDGLKKAGDDAGFLNKQIMELDGNLKKLVVQLDQTGDTSLLKDIRKERRQLNQFKNLAKDLTPDIAGAGTSIGSTLMSAIGTGAKAGGPYLTGVLVAAAAASVPGIAATLGAAVIGGVGIGGIVGGIAIASQDPRVQAAGADIGKQLTSEFQDATRGFVDPILQSLTKVGNAGWAAKLEPTFNKLAKYVEPLTEGAIEAGDNLVAAFERVGDTAGPVLDVVADALPDITAAFEDFIESVSDDPEAAAAALDMFVGAVTDAIRFGGDFIEVLIGIYGIAYDVADALGLIEDETVRLGGKIGQGGATTDVEKFSHATGVAEKKLSDFDDAIKTVFGRTMSVREATLNYQQALDDLTEELTSGQRTLDEHTQAGRDNWAAINNVTESIEEQREARVRQGMGIEESNAKYDQELEALRKQLLALGYNKDAVNKYINEMKKIPQQAITEVHLKGVKAALGDLHDLASAIGAITGYAIVSVASNLGKRASGGPVSAGRNYLVGENGPELLSLGASGGHVYNAGQTASMMSGASGGSSATAGVQEIRLIIDLRGDDEEQVRRIRKQVDVLGGGNVQVAFGKN